MAISFSGLTSRLTSTAWLRNMFSERSRCSPLSQTSASVASPSQRSRRVSPALAGAVEKRTRYQNSDASKLRRSSQLKRPWARNAEATVPGTWAGLKDKASWSRRTGDSGRVAPAGTSASCQPSRTGSVRRGVARRIRAMLIQRGLRVSSVRMAVSQAVAISSMSGTKSTFWFPPTARAAFRISVFDPLEMASKSGAARS